MKINYSNFTLFLLIKNWKIIFFSTISVLIASFYLPDLISIETVTAFELIVLLLIGANTKKIFGTTEKNNKEKLFFTLMYLINVTFIFFIKKSLIPDFFIIFTFVLNYYLILFFYPIIIRQLSSKEASDLIHSLKSNQIKIVLIAYLVPQLIGLLISPISFYFFQSAYLPVFIMLTLSFIIKIFTYIMSASLMTVEINQEEAERICTNNFFSVNFPYFRIQNAIFVGLLSLSLSIALYLSPKKLPDGFETKSAMTCKDGEFELNIKYKNPKNGFISPVSFYLAGEKSEDKLNATLFDLKNNENNMILKFKVDRKKTELNYLDNLNLWYSDKKLEKIKCLD